MSGVSRGLLVLLLALAGLAGCRTHGQLYASQPQVFTRERLVEERVGEVAWLQEQLRKTDQVETGRFQGYRDLSRFVGLHQQLRVSFDPALGGRNEIANEILESRSRTDLLRAQQDELAARQALDNARRAYDESQGIEAAAPPSGQATVTNPTLPSASAPLGSGATSGQLPTSQKPRETQAKPGILDDFHDRLLYRDTVNAAIRQTSLDDTHDLGGMSLHEITMSVTVVPGRDSRAFGQVELRLVKPDATERGPQLARLFDAWRVALRPAMLREIHALHARLAEDRLTRPEREFVEWLRQGGLRAIVASLEGESEVGAAFELQSLAQLRKKPPLVRDFEMIALGVWHRYKSDLSGIVEITRPDFSIGLPGTGMPEITGGLQVTEPTQQAEPAQESDTKDGKGCEDEIECGCPKLQPISAGRCKFVRNLFRAEQSAKAQTVDPKEYAQNVSEVAARRDMLNLIAAVQAMLPAQGVALDSTTQYVRESQELVNAISRRPLLVGFGQGGSRFGWVLGPRFAIDGDDAVFQHQPMRHDVSASISIPGWWTWADLSGEASWIDRRGERRKRGCLWEWDAEHEECKKLRLDVRPDNDLVQSITAALTKSRLRPTPPSGAAFSRKPGPTIELPRDDSAPVLLRAGEEQTLLVLGKNLWRTPQVFVGSQPADRVRLTSDMRGLVATFESLDYVSAETGGTPGPVVADLHVVTSFGADSVDEAVHVLPPRAQTKTVAGAKTARLETRFLDDAQTRLRFAYKEPQNYAKLELVTGPADAATQSPRGHGGLWNAKRTHVEFDHPANAKTPDVYKADLVLYPRPGTDLGKQSVMRSGPALFARFKDKAARSARYTGDPTIDFTASGTTAGKLEVVIESDVRSAFEVAYPGLAKAYAGKQATFVFRKPNGSVRAAIPARLSGIAFTADPAALGKAHAALYGATGSQSLVLRVGDQGESSEIPSTTPVTFTFAPLPSVSAKLPDPSLVILPGGAARKDLEIHIPAPDPNLLEKSYPGFKEAAANDGLAVTLHKDGVSVPFVTLSGIGGRHDSTNEVYILRIPAAGFKTHAATLRANTGTVDVFVVVGKKKIQSTNDLALSTVSVTPPTPTFSPNTLEFSDGKTETALIVTVPDAGRDELDALGVTSLMDRCRVILSPVDGTEDITVDPEPPEGDRVIAFKVEAARFTPDKAAPLLAAGKAKVRLTCVGTHGEVPMDATSDLTFTGSGSGD